MQTVEAVRWPTRATSISNHHTKFKFIIYHHALSSCPRMPSAALFKNTHYFMSRCKFDAKNVAKIHKSQLVMCTNFSKSLQSKILNVGGRTKISSQLANVCINEVSQSEQAVILLQSMPSTLLYLNTI